MKFYWYPKCSTCQKAKRWLDEHNIEYEEKSNPLFGGAGPAGHRLLEAEDLPLLGDRQIDRAHHHDRERRVQPVAHIQLSHHARHTGGRLAAVYGL